MLLYHSVLVLHGISSVWIITLKELHDIQIVTKTESSMVALFYLRAIIWAHWLSQAIRYCHYSSFNRCIFPLFQPLDNLQPVSNKLCIIPTTFQHNKRREAKKESSSPSLSSRRCSRTSLPTGSKSYVEYQDQLKPRH